MDHFMFYKYGFVPSISRSVYIPDFKFKRTAFELYVFERSFPRPLRVPDEHHVGNFVPLLSRVTLCDLKPIR